MTALRVLSINTERTWRGGEGQTLALARGLVARGHCSQLVAQPGSDLEARARAAGLEVRPVRMRGELDVLAIRALRDRMRQFRPDVVHMHTSHAHTLGVLASCWSGQGARIVSRRVDFSIHRHRFGLSGFKYRHGVDRYIAISAAVRDALVKDGVPAGRVALVYSGVDPQRFADSDPGPARRQLGLPAGTPIVGTVAHFGWHKSLETLIAAAEGIVARVPEARVVILGDGRLRPLLEAERKKSPVKERILMPGFQPDVGSFLKAFDVFTMPSVMEGLCTSIMDAFALGIPVAATCAGGIPELVVHESTGLLCPPRDPAALARAVVRLFEDRCLARSLARAARERLEKNFTHHAMVEGTITVYREVLGMSAARLRSAAP